MQRDSYVNFKVMNRFIFILLFLTSCNESTRSTEDNLNDTSASLTPPVIVDTSFTKPETSKVTSPVNDQPRAADNPHWKKKKDEGVNLLVIGNEPFWNMEFRNKQSIIFLLAEWEKAVEIPVDQSFRPGVKNEIKAKNIIIEVVPEKCSDGMSDYTYDYSVKVIYKDTTYNGCGIALAQ